LGAVAGARSSARSNRESSPPRGSRSRARYGPRHGSRHGSRRSGGRASRGNARGADREITGEDRANAPDSARLSEDLHLDSLGRVELQSSIETRFGIAFDDTGYQQVKKLGELKQLLRRPTAGWSAAEPATFEPVTAETATSGRVTAEPARQVHREEHIYPTWPWSWSVRAVRFVFQEATARPLVALLAKPRVACDLASEHAKPLLIVANHVTAFDVPLVLFALPRVVRGRIAVAMAAEMLLDWRKGRGQGNALLNFIAPLQYWLVTALFNVFPLPQAGNFRASFAHAGRAMDRGFHVLVFPEGQRTPDGKMHAFLGGAGILWKELCADALPVYLGGVAELKMTRSNWFRSGRISVHVGKAIAPEGGDPSALTRQLEQAVRALEYSPGKRGQTTLSPPVNL
jgi:long-chain acyl-CoA synthetase